MSPDSDHLLRYIRAIPKVELHVHLEGSIRPATLLALAKRNHVGLPAETVEGLQQWFVYRDFNHFIDIYVAITHCLKTAEDYELIVYEFGAEMARQQVRYAEVTFSPSTHYWFVGIPYETYFTGLARGRERVRKECGVEINWVFDVVRNSEKGEKAWNYTTDVAIDSRMDGVIALGLGGLEAGYPPEPFAPWFDRARAAGLHSVPHAGELDGPASVWGALRALGAERIGHGVRAIEDPALVAYLAEQCVPLEISPTSNVRLSVSPSLAGHPLRRLHDAGVVVTVNSDDPSLFNTTLNDEMETLIDPFGLDVTAIDEIVLNSVRYSFLSLERKQAMEAAFREEMGRLKTVTKEHVRTLER
ncbi:MAG: adenosine deaminase [Candidatus Latescibacteria bacterium]|nr:adenosine deaminase [Candidatus Latescibacterota bacterium]